METRGNYILIGAFTILAVVGALAFFLAFARVELNRSFSYYDIKFDSVAGLAEASDVRFAGLPVGQVVAISLSPELDGTVTVRIEVDAETPVRTDSIATVETQGVTGVGFVAISAGDPASPLDRPEPGEIGTLASGRSVIQTLSEDAPRLVSETLDLIEDVADLFSGENRDRIDQILVNVEDASSAFAATLDDFADVAGSIGDFVTQIDRFNSVLQTLAADFDAALITADVTIDAWGEVAIEAEEFLAEGRGTLAAAEATIGAAETFLADDLTAASTELTATLTDLRTELATLSAQANTALGAFAETGGLANARLAEIEATIDALDALVVQGGEAVTAVETAANDFSVLITEDGAALVAETRTTIAQTEAAVAAIRREAETSLPDILDDVEAASATVARLAVTVESDVTGATGQLETLASDAQSALREATATFAAANDTLTAIEGALVTGEATLTAATAAFSSAEGVLESDVAQIVRRLSQTLDGLDAAIGAVSDDLPQISRNLSAASEAAEDAFDGINGAVQAASPAIAEFAADGLPEYAQFAAEARALTESLDRLVRAIERDPARFFLDPGTPEFQR